MKQQDNFPNYLQDYGKLLSYFLEHFDKRENNTDKGRTFLDFALGFIPHTELGKKYLSPKASAKESHDKGVDAIAEGLEEKSILAIQSKYTVKGGKEEFDSIISKFKDYEHSYINKGKSQAELFSDETNNIHYVIITISNLENIISIYEKSNLGSRAFYDTILRERRITIFDGNQIYTILKSVYRKLYVIPSNINIMFEGSYLYKDNVYIGILSTLKLKEIYDEFGDALFFENIRVAST